MEIKYNKKALKDIEYWKKTGNKIVQNKISALLIDIEKTPYSGIGKPEGLKYELTGKWSRRINEVDRLVYKIEDNSIKVYSLRGHYIDL